MKIIPKGQRMSLADFFQIHSRVRTICMVIIFLLIVAGIISYLNR